ncbi:nitrous oxide reductase accessory protein NosL [Oceanicella actignis]|uniref:nitrous oxide reductase accessory protein NosL n=1 Tax=Oceanicella actignis TaxID=1189325 RepID=UPI0011E7AB0E|nr:nitrous oxide reductase accessory protein NosL [Oceanicella actignis]TYO84573.1 copper chaperone NosL [Oceanicella actignis]
MKPSPMIVAALLALSACREDVAEIPGPIPMTEEALGFYCQMALGEHGGPKGQVHLAGVPAPLFFSQVRDAIAYTRMPEQTDEVVAIYVSDMSRAPGWQEPGKDNWVAASDAFFVVGSDAVGGMGAKEIVPFSVRADADGFAALHGGRVVRLSDIPDSAVLAPAGGDDAGDDEDDYLDRLKATENAEDR